MRAPRSIGFPRRKSFLRSARADAMRKGADVVVMLCCHNIYACHRDLMRYAFVTANEKDSSDTSEDTRASLIEESARALRSMLIVCHHELICCYY